MQKHARKKHIGQRLNVLVWSHNIKARSVSASDSPPSTNTSPPSAAWTSFLHEDVSGAFIICPWPTSIPACLADVSFNGAVVEALRKQHVQSCSFMQTPNKAVHLDLYWYTLLETYQNKTWSLARHPIPREHLMPSDKGMVKTAWLCCKISCCRTCFGISAVAAGLSDVSATGDLSTQLNQTKVKWFRHSCMPTVSPSQLVCKQPFQELPIISIHSSSFFIIFIEKSEQVGNLELWE